ncbi:hypothetical protein HK097_006651 [Rhizophlyctis rosea]|uniref:EF-hand domain-containing protein n=1 Tax=Rhizophlyctis rosea TaxID=64517 RepID=A0AAD5RZK9_9FUNG|nr:hypothetical protein HK097_006651 [Rhizophlyctis rosea]
MSHDGPLSRSDIDLAFDLLSRDGRKVSREDVKFFVERFLGGGNGASGAGDRGVTPVPGGDRFGSKVNVNPGTPNARAGSAAAGGGMSGGGVGGGQNDTDQSGGDIWKTVSAEKSKLVKSVVVGKEDVTREGLMNLLVHRSLAVVPFEEAMQWFDPHADNSTSLDESDLRKIAKLLNPRGVVEKGDVKALLSAFDKDGDGSIGPEDFKKMTLDFC